MSRHHYHEATSAICSPSMFETDITAGASRPPRLSVVIPVYNAAADLERCLSALARSSGCPWPWEVIVVDDGSADDSAGVARRHGARLVTLGENGGPARARNQGASAARGELLLFIDADVFVHPDTVARVAAAFASDPDLAALIGSYDDQPAAPSFLSQYKNLFHHYVHQRGRAEASTFWSGCGAIRRRLFLAIGGFDEGYRVACVEDIELGFRLRRAGHRIRLEKQLQVTHGKPWPFANLLATDLFRRGVPWVALMLRDRRMTCDLNLSWRDRICAGLTYLLAGSLVLAAVPIDHPWLHAWLPLGLLTAFLAIQRDFYRFFLRARGGLFALRVLPMHLLYFLYSGAAVPLGVAAFIAEQRRVRRDGLSLSDSAFSSGRMGLGDASTRAEAFARAAVERERA
jgi:GT2 family glycosyltransferase